MGESEAAKKFHVDFSEVEEIIEALEQTSCGPDEIPTIFLQKNLHWSASIITSILNLSLQRDDLPKSFLTFSCLSLHGNQGKISGFQCKLKPEKVKEYHYPTLEGSFKIKKLFYQLET